MIKKSIVERVLQKALSNGADFSEIFLEDSTTSTMQLLDSKIVNSITGNDYGVGIRVFMDIKRSMLTQMMSQKKVFSKLQKL